MLLGISLVLMIVPWLFGSYETIGFILLPTPAEEAPAATGEIIRKDIPPVDLAVIADALLDQGYGATAAYRIATQFREDLATPVTTATNNPFQFATPSPSPTPPAATQTQTPSRTPIPTLAATSTPSQRRHPHRRG